MIAFSGATGNGENFDPLTDILNWSNFSQDSFLGRVLQWLLLGLVVQF